MSPEPTRDEEVEPRTPLVRIGVAAERVGLPTHTLRLWEDRYGAIEPERSEANYRLYGPDQLRRLRLLARLTRGDYAIREVAGLPDAGLAELVERSEGLFASHDAPPLPGDALRLEQLYSAALDAVREFQTAELRRVLRRATLRTDLISYLDEFLAPLLTAIGTSWNAGEISVSCERGATDVVLAHLFDLLTRWSSGPRPAVVLATLPGSQHGIGVLMATVLVRSLGVGTLHLGTGVPPEELAVAADEVDAEVVGVGITYTHDVAAAADSLRRLRAALRDGVWVVTGGAAAPDVVAALPGELSRSRHLGSVADLGAFLDDV